MTREDIIRMAREAELEIYLAPNWDLLEQLERFAALVAAAEREACAEVCVRLAIGGEFAADCAAAIRARGDK